MRGKEGGRGQERETVRKDETREGGGLKNESDGAIRR